MQESLVLFENKISTFVLSLEAFTNSEKSTDSETKLIKECLKAWLS